MPGYEFRQLSEEKDRDRIVENMKRDLEIANRPSGKKGSYVTMVPKASNYEWDKLIWILYDPKFVIQEAWEWSVQDYKYAFVTKKSLSPNDYRKGKCLYLSGESQVQVR